MAEQLLAAVAGRGGVDAYLVAMQGDRRRRRWQHEVWVQSSQ
jgi:hypothetical protein